MTKTDIDVLQKEHLELAAEVKLLKKDIKEMKRHLVLLMNIMKDAMDNASKSEMVI
jgi:hypothetical protein